MLEISHLSLSIPSSDGMKPAVTDVSLTLKPGHVLGLVGESGCGKSLTAQATLRLGEYQGVQCTDGAIMLDGHNILTMPDEEIRKLRGATISIIFQEPMTALNPVFSIGSQMMEMIRLHLHLSRQDAHARAISLLEDVGLQNPEHLLTQYSDALSGGMRQRVLIAMAMAAKPDYIIADEPTTALDVSVQARIVELLRDLQQQRGLGMLLVTHDFGLIAELADEVAVMYAGHIIEYGAVKTVFDHPAHPYTQALLQCRPEVATKGEAISAIQGQVPPPGKWPSGCRFAPRCTWHQTDCDQVIHANAWQREQHHARCVHVHEKTQP